MNQIIKRIKNYRLQMGYSQEKIAEKLNISQSAYAKLEKGVTRLDLERLYQICSILDIDLPELLRLDLSGELTSAMNLSGIMGNHTDPKPEALTIRHLKEEIRFLRQMLKERS